MESRIQKVGVVGGCGHTDMHAEREREREYKSRYWLCYYSESSINFTFLLLLKAAVNSEKAHIYTAVHIP